VTVVGQGPEARGEGQAGIGHQRLSSSPSPLAPRLLSFICLCAALVCVYGGLREFDGPVAGHLRAITTPEGGGTLTVPWMAFVSQAGNWLGDGRQLLTVSAMLMALGWAYPPSRGMRTGIETLWAHGIATVLVHTVKHLVGRPRPKFSTSGDWEMAPSLLSGFDSFPSGHTTATFALAVVLSRRFPHYSLLFFGAGAFVALSRVLRGSHFTTDVFGGAVLGLVSGALAMLPWKDWRVAIETGVRQAAIGTVWVFALLWAVTHPMPSGWDSILLMGLGAGLTGLGLWCRLGKWRHAHRVWRIAIALGLSLMTASPLVMAAAGFLCLGLWICEEQNQNTAEDSRSLAIVRNGELVAAVLLSLAVLVVGRGALHL
jgi:membrane-associated phospholipid phosphatase